MSDNVIKSLHLTLGSKEVTLNADEMKKLLAALSELRTSGVIVKSLESDVWLWTPHWTSGTEALPVVTHTTTLHNGTSVNCRFDEDVGQVSLKVE